MASVTEVGQLKALMSYLPDGVAAALEGVLRFLPQDIKMADDLTLYVSNTDTIAANGSVSATDGARPLAAVVVSKGQAGWVTIGNDTTSASHSATDGEDVDILIPFGTNTDEATAVSFHGDSYKRFWDAAVGIQVSSSSSSITAPTAMTSIPTIYILAGKV